MVDLFNFVLLIVILLLIGLWNAYVILWGTEKKSTALKMKFSKIWHAIGLILRIVIWAYYPIIMYAKYYNTQGFEFISSTNILINTALLIFVGGLLYDFIINVVRFLYIGKPELFYVDNKGWNAFFLKFLSPKMYWIIRFVVAIAVTVIAFLFN